ncbi:MAG: hypothetical protein IPP57_06420 [Candidatus Obscuribacter sp.]|jgi:hypothetical protein|nr:hypothetical protein [Candidatus Obscuribacter sp.]MBK9770446.1 hypothetical protein [Candidatus Obscuribacter sp.]
MRQVLNLKDPVGIILEGDTLSPTAARKLQRSLIYEPCNIKTRLSLIGYYFTRYHFSDLKNWYRVQNIYWCIEHLQSIKVFESGFCMIFESEDQKHYQSALKLWSMRLEQEKNNADLWLCFAAWIIYSDWKLAEDAVARAKRLKPEHKGVKKLAKNIEKHRETSFKSLSEQELLSKSTESKTDAR